MTNRVHPAEAGSHSNADAKEGIPSQGGDGSHKGPALSIGTLPRRYLALTGISGGVSANTCHVSSRRPDPRDYAY